MKWVNASPDEWESEEQDHAVGWMGGFVQPGMRWDEYIAEMPEDTHAVCEELRKGIIADRVWRGGDWHQESGIPVLADGRHVHLSFRAWGDLLAATWATELDRDFGYMDFYMNLTLPAKPEGWT